MRKIIITFIVILLATISLCVYLYVSATKPLKQLEQVAVTKAKEVVNFKNIDEVFVLNGKETSYSVKGIDENTDEVIVFISEKNSDVIVKKASEGITKEQAIAIVTKEKTPQKVVSVKLGLENKTPVWEVYYKSKSSSLNYYYIDFHTGEWHKKIENL